VPQSEIPKLWPAPGNDKLSGQDPYLRAKRRKPKVFWFFSSEKNKNLNCSGGWRQNVFPYPIAAYGEARSKKDNHEGTKALLLRLRPKGAIIKSLLFLKKKKQKDFCSWWCAPIRAARWTCALEQSRVA
jgi:hypothetical protein